MCSSAVFDYYSQLLLAVKKLFLLLPLLQFPLHVST